MCVGRYAAELEQKVDTMTNSGDLKSQFFTITPAAPMAPTLELVVKSLDFMVMPSAQNAQALGSVYASEGRDSTDLGAYFAKNRVATGGPSAGVGMAKR